MSPEARERSFDELARGLANGNISRGKALRLMGAALLGSALGSLGIGGVAAADELCKPEGKKCRKNAQCCSGNCSSRGTCVGRGVGCVPLGSSCTTNDECCAGLCINRICRVR